MPRLHLLLSVALLVGSVERSGAADPLKLVELRAIYERERDVFRARALAKHIAKLTELQEALTREGHLEDAQVVAAKVSQRTRELARIQAANQPGIVLKPDAARLVGGLRLVSRAIGNWNDPSCIATWSPRGIPPGKYQMHLDYIPVIGGGGVVEVRDLKSRASVRIPPAAAADRRPRSARVGTINIGKSVTFRVAPRSKSKTGIFLLTGIRLTPVSR